MLQCWSTETVCAGRGRQEYIVLLWESFKHYKLVGRSHLTPITLLSYCQLQQTTIIFLHTQSCIVLSYEHRHTHTAHTQL